MSARTRPRHIQSHNGIPPVPEMNPKTTPAAKNPHFLSSGTAGSAQQLFHEERPISDAYAEIDNDLARDNIENDLPDADLQDL